MKYLAGYLVHIGSTLKHKCWVGYYLLPWALRYAPLRAWPNYVWRGVVHDASKFTYAESDGFARTIFDLKTSTYGSDEYRALLRQIKPSIQHHYQRNSHHPEHWPGGYAQMPPTDRIEMVADWSAAVRRHADGDLGKSITQNADRFGYDEAEAARLRRVAAEMGAL